MEKKYTEPGENPASERLQSGLIVSPIHYLENVIGVIPERSRTETGRVR